MNKFAQNKSKIFLAFVWLFLAATFADGANLDDLLPGFIVVHSDEDNATQTESELLTPSATKTPVHSHSLPQPLQKKEDSQPTPPLRIIYDQDSDSLAAAPVPLAESFVPLLPETLVEYESAASAHSLYLLNCTLLI
jgi:hypothetical protein